MQPLASDDPSSLGPHRLLARLGAGGMGRVYLARTPDGHLCAMKVVKEELAHDAQFRARFAREVRTAQRVRGPFTPAVVDADPDAPAPWMATEYVPGPTLKEAVRENGPFPAESLLVLTLGLARALSTIHAAGLMHRDLKPGNILLSPRGPQVIDFGIARAVEGTVLTRTGQTFGTPSYTSPEQIVGKNVTPKADVFSMAGAVLFAASGRPPFGEGTSISVLNKVMNGEPDLGALPEGPLRPLLARCLEKDPARRPDADEVLRELSGTPLPSAEHGWLPTQVDRQIDARAVETERAGTNEHTTVPLGGGSATVPLSGQDHKSPESWWRRRSVVVAAAAVCALVLLGGGALAWTVLPDRAEDPPPAAEGGGEDTDTDGSDADPSEEGADDEERPASDHFAGFVYTIDFSEDGDLVHVFGSGTLSTWDRRTGELIEDYPPATGARFTSTGYVASTVEQYIRVWDGGVDDRIAVLGRTEEFGMFDMPAITRDGSTLAALASQDGTVEGDPFIQIWDVEKGEVTSDFEVEGMLTHLEYALDDSVLVGVLAVRDYSESIATVVWDPETGEELHRFDDAGRYDARVSADGETLVVAADNEEAFVVDLADGDVQDLDVPEDAVGELGYVALSPDGSVAYGASSLFGTSEGYMWDTGTGELLPSEGLEFDSVIGVDPGGEYLATTSTDGGVTSIQILNGDFEIVAEIS
ncbi:WD40 repeat domain-containing serine/threonine protein kinase [Nocardiopsis alba]|uniref:WD40 repeat domain-containing serine/threonine protein kinase n=1 Tax=Nocardiopsis alba TaxID=53437 RepID=UPI00366AB897